MEGLDPELPPIGNGTYVVKMKLSRDIPNWMPMYGRKICLEYPGSKRQCNNCYGAHAKKFCRSEKCGMENFVSGFSKAYPQVPAQLYRRLAHLVKPPGAMGPDAANVTSSLPHVGPGSGDLPATRPRLESGSRSPPFREVRRQKQSKPKSQYPPQHKSNSESGSQAQSHEQPESTLKQKSAGRPQLRISLTKGVNGDWSTNGNRGLVPAQPLTNSVANNVSSFLHGIRASFRQDNVIVAATQKSKINQ